MSAVKLRLLFVDDEPAVLKLLQLSLKPLAQQWEMRFAEKGQIALDLMAEKPFDIVVSDMRMPGMTGAQLLNEVVKRSPATVRIILSGFTDQDMVLKSVGATHQFLAKPFDPAALRKMLQRIAALRQRLQNDDLQRLVSRVSCLPAIPRVYVELLDALQSQDCPVENIGAIVAQDPALTAKVLQLVNSAFFGFARDVSDPTEAVQLLGLSVIRSLAITVHLFSSFDAAQFKELAIDELWHHSLRTSFLARAIVEADDCDTGLTEQALTAGLLHDVGKLVIAACVPDEYRTVLETARVDGRPHHEIERERLRTTHAEVGAYLVGLWGLPTPLVEAVAFHHAPAESGDATFSPLTAVHVASLLADNRLAVDHEALLSIVDSAYLKRLGLLGRLSVWQAAARAN